MRDERTHTVVGGSCAFARASAQQRQGRAEDGAAAVACLTRLGERTTEAGRAWTAPKVRMGCSVVVLTGRSRCTTQHSTPRQTLDTLFMIPTNVRRDHSIDPRQSGSGRDPGLVDRSNGISVECAGFQRLQRRRVSMEKRCLLQHSDRRCGLPLNGKISAKPLPGQSLLHRRFAWESARMASGPFCLRRKESPHRQYRPIHYGRP